MTAFVPSDYSDLITSEHDDKPRFMAVVELLVGPFCDAQAVLATIPGLYDIDTATGVQLDAVGKWVGFPRQVYVSTLGGVVTLNDDDYRTLLRAKIKSNHWDGSNDTLQDILASLFPGSGITLFAVDNQDMSMDIYLTNGTLTAVQVALIESGLLIPKPEGVRINGIFVVAGGPLFGLDYSDASIDGFDVGAFRSYI